MRKFLKISAAVATVFTVVFSAAALLYWHSLKDEPHYSLALIVDAARRDDQAAIAELVDSDLVVDDLLPQVIDKAVEMYGRGLPLNSIAKATAAATPLMPAVKERARAELPALIKRETGRLADIPFPAMVIGSDRYLDFRTDGDIAYATSKDPKQPVEIRMRRNGERWTVVGVRDEKLAGDIARQVGQEIISIALNSGKTGASNTVDSLIEQLKKAIQ